MCLSLSRQTVGHYTLEASAIPFHDCRRKIQNVYILYGCNLEQSWFVLHPLDEPIPSHPNITMKFSLAAFGIAISFLSYGAHAADASVNDLLLLAVASTNQTDGPSAGDWPNQAPAKAEVATNTSTSTVDLATIQSDDSTSKRSSLPPQVYNLGNIVARRTDYSVLTDGSDPLYSNAALQATSYLTYTVISNTTTYAVAKAACLAYCDSVKKCVTANMYNEIGNPLLDHV